MNYTLIILALISWITSSAKGIIVDETAGFEALKVSILPVLLSTGIYLILDGNFRIIKINTEKEIYGYGILSGFIYPPVIDYIFNKKNESNLVKSFLTFMLAKTTGIEIKDIKDLMEDKNQKDGD